MVCIHISVDVFCIITLREHVCFSYSYIHIFMDNHVKRRIRSSDSNEIALHQHGECYRHPPPTATAISNEQTYSMNIRVCLVFTVDTK